MRRRNATGVDSVQAQGMVVLSKLTVTEIGSVRSHDARELTVTKTASTTEIVAYTLK